MSNVKEIIDFVLVNEYKKGQMFEDDRFRLGYLQAIDTLITHLGIALSVENNDDLLDHGHDSVFHLKDGRLYRLDTVSDKKGPFIEPVTPGYGGKKRYVIGSNLNGLFPGVALSSPNFIPKS